MELSICRCCYSIICRFISNCTLALCCKSKVDIIISIGCCITYLCHLQCCRFFCDSNVNAIRCSRMVRALCHANGNGCCSGFQQLYISGAVHCQNFRCITCIGQCSVTSVLIYGKCKFRIAVGLVPDGSNRYLSGCLTHRQCTLSKTDLIICACQSARCDDISSCVTVGILRCICFSVIT